MMEVFYMKKNMAKFISAALSIAMLGALPSNSFADDADTAVSEKDVKCINIEVQKPVRTVYYNGMGLDLTGFSATAEYSDGTSEDLNAEDCIFKMNSIAVSEGSILSPGTKNITVYRKNERGIASGFAVGSFNVKVKKEGTKI